MACLTPRLGRSIAPLVFALILSSSCLAQCLAWDHGFWPPPQGNGFTGPGQATVHALRVFDDGTGPALYAGGSFDAAGSVPAQNIARWNGFQWSAVGSPPESMAGGVNALTIFDEGAGPRLFAAGYFRMSHCGASKIARFDGTTWSALTNDIISYYPGPGIAALVVHDDGNGRALYAGGSFWFMTGQGLMLLVTRWDGTQYSQVGNELGPLPGSAPSIHALADFDAGAGAELYAGGEAFGINGSDAHGFVKWDGTHWNIVGGGVDGLVSALDSFDDGSGPALYVGGLFQSAGGLAVANIARWNGSQWSAVGAGLPSAAGTSFGGVHALTVFDDGSGPALYAAGAIAGGVSKWDGNAWTPLMSSYTGPWMDEGFRSLASFDDGLGTGLFAGGGFTTIGTLPSSAIGEWHGCTSSPGYFCAGDGGEIDCPCSNNGLAGRGCDNSAATGGAQLSVAGTTNPDTLVISILGEVGSSTTVVMQGDLSLGFVPFGDGLRCVGGHLRRLYVAAASGGALSVPGPGDPSISARSAALGDPLTAGAVRFYQAQYRDPVAGFCVSGATFNATNAVRMVW
jgi:hypothetical protein